MICVFQVSFSSFQPFSHILYYLNMIYYVPTCHLLPMPLWAYPRFAHTHTPSVVPLPSRQNISVVSPDTAHELLYKLRKYQEISYFDDFFTFDGLKLLCIQFSTLFVVYNDISLFVIWGIIVYLKLNVFNYKCLWVIINLFECVKCRLENLRGTHELLYIENAWKLLCHMFGLYIIVK